MGKYLAARRLALAAQDFGILGRRRFDFDRLAVGDGAEALSCLLATGPEQRRLGQALGLHAIKSLARDLLGEIGPEDTHIDHIDAQLFHIRMDQI